MMKKKHQGWVTSSLGESGHWGQQIKQSLKSVQGSSSHLEKIAANRGVPCNRTWEQLFEEAHNNDMAMWQEARK